MGTRQHALDSLALAAVVSLSLLGCIPRAAAVEECQYHGIEEAALSMPFSVIEVGPADVVYGWSAHALWASLDRGETWSQIRAFSDTIGCRGLFVANSGDVFVGVTRQGCLWKGVPGTVWSWSTPLVFNCGSCATTADNSAMWKMCEDNSGRLFAGEYGGAWEDTCAYVYRSEDGGDTWALVYQCPSRHVHFVSADPYTNKVYASIGDGPGRYQLLCSSDGGDSWEVLYSQDCLAEPVSVSFTPTTRIFGSDCGFDLNRIYTTTDDEVFDTRLLLAGELDAYIWDMSQDDNGYIYAGTVAKLPSGSEIHLYASYDGGENWCGVKSFGVLPEWGGVKDISRFDSAGWAYCAYTTSLGAGATFRFRHTTASGIANPPPRPEASAYLQVSRRGDGYGAVFGIDLSDGASSLSLRVYNLRGACVCTVVEGAMPPGYHELVWDGTTDSGRNVSQGVYFVQLRADDAVVGRKVVVLPGM